MHSLRVLLAELLSRTAAYQAEGLLTFAYYTAVAVAWVMARFGRRRLLPDTFGTGGSHWIRRKPLRKDPRSLSRQF